jgi:transcription elongation factor Elf1
MGLVLKPLDLFTKWLNRNDCFNICMVFDGDKISRNNEEIQARNVVDLLNKYLICANCNKLMKVEKYDQNITIGTNTKILFKCDIYHCGSCNARVYYRFGEPILPSDDIYNAYLNDSVNIPY